MIRVDESAICEGLPLRRQDWETYLRWAVCAFKLATSGVLDETQIHIHMCYSEFGDILETTAEMDTDVISIETSRSKMELLADFARFRYPNEIGLGVHEIHSPRGPTREEMAGLLLRAGMVLPATQLWVNPDCGLKTRGWPEVEAALVKHGRGGKIGSTPYCWYDIMSHGPLDPSRCPLCRQQNKCGIVEDSGTCWCFSRLSHQRCSSRCHTSPSALQIFVKPNLKKLRECIRIWR